MPPRHHLGCRAVAIRCRRTKAPAHPLTEGNGSLVHVARLLLAAGRLHQYRRERSRRRRGGTDVVVGVVVGDKWP
eukprot:764816-Prymnesium_polylepis.1